MNYKICMTQQVKEYLDGLDNKEKERILKRIRKLEKNPKNYLERKGNSWILKIGRSGYRIAVDIDKDRIIILFIQKRSKFYKEYEV